MLRFLLADVPPPEPALPPSRIAVYVGIAAVALTALVVVAVVRRRRRS